MSREVRRNTEPGAGRYSPFLAHRRSAARGARPKTGKLHEAPGWRVDYRVDAGHLVLVVRLRALQARDVGAIAYREQLVRYKAEVLGWLATQAAPAVSYVIEWHPSEAASL